MSERGVPPANPGCVVYDTGQDVRRFAGDIAGAEKECFSEPWSLQAVNDFLSYSYNGALVARLDGAFAGYITYSWIADEIQIANVAVLMPFRRRGIAGGLLGELVRMAAVNHVAKIGLEVRAANQPARALYEKNGFVPVGVRRNYYKNPTEDAVLYDRILEKPQKHDRCESI